SSASRDSDSVVNPTRSAKSTETSLRSAAGASRTGGLGATTTTAPGTSGAPQSPQNFTPEGLGLPHSGHERASELPHSPQNFRRGSFSAPQFGQSVISVRSLLPHCGVRKPLLPGTARALLPCLCAPGRLDLSRAVPRQRAHEQAAR